MSDQLGNAEIEDVLSSIRRLVAGDKVAGDGAGARRAAEPTAPEAPEGDERVALVLTPSLRVADAPDDEIEREAEQWDMDAAEASEDTEEAFTADRSSDDAGEDVTGFGGESARADGRPDADDRAAVTVDDAKDAPFEDSPSIASFIRPRSAAFPQDGDPAARPFDQDLPTEEDGGSDDGEDVPALPFVHRRSGSPRNAPRVGFHFGSLRDDEPAESGASTGREEVAEAGEPDDTERGPEAVFTRSRLRDDIAEDPKAPPPMSADEAADTGWDAATEFQNSEEDPWDNFGVELEPDDPLDRPGTVPESEQSAAGGGENLFSASDVTIDEAVLRDLVTEMLHRELQGPLGERITRNVRKLVRREIHRVLAARDFD